MIALPTVLLILFACHGAVSLLERLTPISIPGLGSPDQVPRVSEVLFGIAVRVALGMGLCSTLLYVVGAVAFPSRGVLLLATGCLAAVGAASIPWTRLSRALPRSPVEAVLCLIMGGAAVVLFSLALVPELEIDEVVYHLAAPRAWMNEGRVVGLPTEVMSYFTFLSQSGSLWAMLLAPGDIGAPRVLELGRCLVAAMAAGALAGWLAGRRTGLVVMVLAVLLEEYSRWGTTAQVDAGQSVYTITAVGMLMGWLAKPGDDRPLAVAGVLLGFSIGVKDTGWLLAGGIAAPAAMLRLIQMYSHGEWPPRRFFRETLMIVLPMLAMALPWLIRSVNQTGNPFFPFLWQVFPVRESLEVSFNQFNDYYNPEERVLSEILIPSLTHLYVVISNTLLTNVNGLVIWGLMGMLALILARRYGKDPMDGARWLPALVTLPMTFLLIQAPFWRFLIVAWPIALVTGATGVVLLANTAERRKLLLVVTALLILLFMQAFYSINMYRQPGAKSIAVPPRWPLLTTTAVNNWLEKHDPHHAFVVAMDRELGPEDRVLFGLETPSIVLIESRFLPNVKCVSDEIVLVLNRLGWEREAIARHVATLDVTHLATGSDFPVGAASDFAGAHLELVLEDEDGGGRLYKIVDLPRP
ncbi:MAG: hypothetical protein JJU11_05000 [Candidatus Sumerlaeia bacterium]|nr:hypothetical protein [Candidatus Sumerlaeia bacterium]